MLEYRNLIDRRRYYNLRSFHAYTPTSEYHEPWLP